MSFLQLRSPSIDTVSEERITAAIARSPEEARDA